MALLGERAVNELLDGWSGGRASADGPRLLVGLLTYNILNLPGCESDSGIWILRFDLFPGQRDGV